MVIGPIVPEQVVSGDGPAIHVFHRQGGGIDEQIVERDQIIATGEAMIVVDEGIVKHMNRLGNAGRPEIFVGFGVIHQSQSSLAVAADEIVLDEKESIRKVGLGIGPIVDQLNSVR